MFCINNYLSKPSRFLFQMHFFKWKSERNFKLNFSYGVIQKKEITALYDQKEKFVETKIHCRFNNINVMNYHDRGNIQVGIIGGGLSPIYASMLLKQYRLIKCIHLVDTKDILDGAVFDAGHIDTSTQIKHYNIDEIDNALKNIDIIALLDENDFQLGKYGPRDQFVAASNYVRRIAELVVQIRPEALLAIFIRPVTATLPFVSEIYKYAGYYNPERIIGSTSIETMRIETAAANLLGLDPTCFHVPIVAGADACTVVPLLSRAKPVNQFANDHEDFLLQILQSADNELAGTLSKGPVLSTGVAIAKFILILAYGLNGCKDAIVNAYVKSNVLPICQYFTNQVQFGLNGIEKNLGLPKASAREVALIEKSIPIINENVSLAMSLIHEKNQD